MPASTIALPGSSTTSSGVIAARISGETEESGPSTSTRDGPEHRVAHEAGDGGVEPGDRGQAGELGVRHALRDEDRREHEAGDEVGTHPAAAGTSGRPRPRAPTVRATWPGSMPDRAARLRRLPAERAAAIGERQAVLDAAPGWRWRASSRGFFAAGFFVAALRGRLLRGALRRGACCRRTRTQIVQSSPSIPDRWRA